MQASDGVPSNERHPSDRCVSSLLTVGHSNHPLDTLLDLLRKHRVQVLVDTRSQPYSRYSPHFDRESLERAVREASIQYVYMGDCLGGRPTQRECYDVDGKVRYDKVEQQGWYQEGIERLVGGALRYLVCLLCSEEDPIRCHRRLLIARSLLGRGFVIDHIRGDGRLEPEAEVQVRYERELPDGKQLRLF